MVQFMKEGQEKPKMECQFVDGGDDVCEWKYEFGEEKQIQVIELFNF